MSSSSNSVPTEFSKVIGDFIEDVSGTFPEYNALMKKWWKRKEDMKVKDGESLSTILEKYYGNTGLNMKIIEISIIEINKHAFVRENPHFLYAGKILKIPSVSEIMNLVRKTPDKNSNSKSSQRNHIYFYGN